MNNTSGEQPRKIVPPLYMAAGIILVFVLDSVFSGLRLDSSWLDPVAKGLALTGGVIIAWPLLAFLRVGTGVIPFSEANSLVTGGLYRISRNPMYLGMLLFIISATVKTGNPVSLMAAPLFILLINKNFIRGEERFLEAAFGEEYLAYKSSVRRWL